MADDLHDQLLRMKNVLAGAVLAYQRENNLTQKQVAHAAGVTQPDISAIISCQFDRRYTLDRLIAVVIRLGYNVTIEASDRNRWRPRAESNRRPDA